MSLHKPPCRLVRFDHIAADVVCLFDEKKNLLRIDLTNYESLSPQDQTRVFRACESMVITSAGKPVLKHH